MRTASSIFGDLIWKTTDWFFRGVSLFVPYELKPANPAGGPMPCHECLGVSPECSWCRGSGLE